MAQDNMYKEGNAFGTPNLMGSGVNYAPKPTTDTHIIVSDPNVSGSIVEVMNSFDPNMVKEISAIVEQSSTPDSYNPTNHQLNDPTSGFYVMLAGIALGTAAVIKGISMYNQKRVNPNEQSNLVNDITNRDPSRGLKNVIEGTTTLSEKEYLSDEYKVGGFGQSDGAAKKIMYGYKPVER